MKNKKRKFLTIENDKGEKVAIPHDKIGMVKKEGSSITIHIVGCQESLNILNGTEEQLEKAYHEIMNLLME